jgi:CBS domain-containing protein
MDHNKSISDLLDPDHRLITIVPDAFLREAATKLSRHQIGCLPVVDAAGGLLGVLSERDLVSRGLAVGRDGDRTRVEEIMTTDIVTCPGNMTVHEAEKLMAHRRIRHLPVTRGGRVVGILSMRDVLAESLRSWKDLARSQSALLDDLESTHPGISQIRRDKSGRVVI